MSTTTDPQGGTFRLSMLLNDTRYRSMTLQVIAAVVLAHLRRQLDGEIAMWVKQTEARAVRRILARQSAHKRGLARAGLPDDPKMGEPVGFAHHEGPPPVAVIGVADPDLLSHPISVARSVAPA